MKLHRSRFLFVAILATSTLFLVVTKPLYADDPQPVSAAFGGAGILDMQFSDSSGAANLTSVWMAITGPNGDALNECIVTYLPQSNVMYVLDDSGNLSGGPIPMGSQLYRGNSQCAVNARFSSASISGNTLTWRLSLATHNGFEGYKPVFMAAASATANSGWQQIAAVRMPTPDIVDIVGLSPIDGTASTQLFQLKEGHSSFGPAQTWIEHLVVYISADAGAPANSCVIVYDWTHQYFLLLDDSGSNWIGPAAVGSATVLSNSQCSFDASQSTVVDSSVLETWTIPLSFSPVFAGTHSVWGGSGPSINATGWQLLGTWTAP